MTLELLEDVLVDSVRDTLTLVPFLLVTYLVMETLEHSAEGKAESLIRRAGTTGPAIGALLGALPQCGFSAMAGTLYAGRLITAGTLVAVVLSTSDELIPVFVARHAPASRLVAIMVAKVAIGMVVGFAADAVLRRLHRTGDGHPRIRELCERAHCHCGDIDDAEVGEFAHTSHDHAEAHDHGEAHAHGHGHEHAHSHAHGHPRSRLWHIVRCSLVHTAQVSLFIFVITLLFGLVIEGMGQEAIAALFARHPLRATFAAGLVGLIPNCGASVAISELFLDGTLATGPTLTGLLVSGGMGLLVLFRTNADLRQNLIIAAFVYLVGVFVGLVAGMLGIVL